jgi:hypothetical protein
MDARAVRRSAEPMTTSKIESMCSAFELRRVGRGRFVPYRGEAGCSSDGCLMHARWRLGRRPVCDTHRSAALREPRIRRFAAADPLS